MMQDLFWEVLSDLENKTPGGFGLRYKGLPRRFKKAIYAVDSSTIALVANCMSWAKLRRREAPPSFEPTELSAVFCSYRRG